MKSQVIKWTSTVLFAVMVLTTVLTLAFPVPLKNADPETQYFVSLLTPAPIAYALWIGIYGLIGLMIPIAWGFFGRSLREEPTEKSIPILFMLTCLLNTGWTLARAFHVPWLSVAFVIPLLVLLAVMTHRMKKEHRSDPLRRALYIGFELYFGWIIAGAAATIGTLLVNFGAEFFGLSAVVWTILALAVGGIMGAVPALLDQRFFASIAVIWAYTGVLINHISIAGFAGRYPVIIAFCAMEVVMLLVSIIVRAYILKPEKAMQQHA